MPKLPDVTVQDGTIHKGATFYWEVTLYDNISHTDLTDLDGFTPSAVLMLPNGTKLSDISCALLPATELLPPRIAMVVSQSITSVSIKAGVVYPYNLDLVATDGERYRKLRGELEGIEGYGA